MISLIAAMGKNRVIGLDNQMPWHMPADLAHFKHTTLNKPIVMGRKTYESIGRPLPGRRNIVVSRQADLKIEGVEVVSSLDEAFALLNGEPEIMIMGGATIYEQVLPIADRLYLTLIDCEVDGDAYFPQWDMDKFKEIARESHKRDEKNAHDYSFVVLERL